MPRRKPSNFVSFKNTLRKPPTKKNVSPLAFSLKCEIYHSFHKSANAPLPITALYLSSHFFLKEPQSMCKSFHFISVLCDICTFLCQISKSLPELHLFSPLLSFLFKFHLSKATGLLQQFNRNPSQLNLDISLFLFVGFFVIYQFVG